ncbi:DUF4232 domain-containing protein [Streptomyces sp. NPDC012794]|uniref:DUF4232 domain-containing protein n=1 Tax=Streptomyces sp. NPDC012794 TaxID=3364850 RepID=UPI00367F7D03
MGAARSRSKRCVIGVAAVAALLSSTACEAAGGTGPGRASATPSGSPSTTASPAPGGTSGPPSAPGSPSATPSTPGTPTSAQGSPAPGKSGGPGTGSDAGDGKGTAAACTDAHVSITGAFERQDSEQNLFLTAVNTGAKPCTLYFYPIVRFRSADEVPPPPMESPARALATIKPGEKAYAGVRLFRAGEQTSTVTSLTVAFHSRTANDEVGGAAGIPLPHGFLNIDSKPMVTFWNLDAAAVKNFTFKAR